jgi:hypothetical protein
MNEGGFYKRRRGIVEHIESGKVDLLDTAIHDYLLLKVNVFIGNGYHLPAGVLFTSAPALHAVCKSVSIRTIQRRLKHLEKIGWLKMWQIPGKRGNYAVLICRADVIDMSRKQFRVSGELTMDWRQPVYEPVADAVSGAAEAVSEVAGYKESKNKENIFNKTSKKDVAEITPGSNTNYKDCYRYALETFRIEKGTEPTWNGTDRQNVKQFLRDRPSLLFPDWMRAFRNFLRSRKQFIREQGFSLTEFVAHFDSFFAGLDSGPQNFDGRRRRQTRDGLNSDSRSAPVSAVVTELGGGEQIPQRSFADYAPKF